MDGETRATATNTHLGERSTATGIVDDVSDNTLDVTMTLGVVLREGGGDVRVSFGISRVGR